MSQSVQQNVQSLSNEEAMKVKVPSADAAKKVLEILNTHTTSEQRSEIRKNEGKHCDKFYETDTSSDSVGYLLCCEWLGYCPGMSGWLIFLIILLVLGGLAASGAAFFFFYWRRKMGGRDIEKDVDSVKSSTKSEYDISVDTY